MIIIFRQASRSSPHDIIEAACIDGLSEIGIFFCLQKSFAEGITGAVK